MCEKGIGQSASNFKKLVSDNVVNLNIKNGNV